MQKPIKSKQNKKQQPALKHRKGSKTRKGRLEKPPRRQALQKDHSESAALTKAINAENEDRFAAVASKSLGASKLSLLKAPVHETADQKQRRSHRPGQAWGASSK